MPSAAKKPTHPRPELVRPQAWESNPHHRLSSIPSMQSQDASEIVTIYRLIEGDNALQGKDQDDPLVSVFVKGLPSYRGDGLLDIRVSDLYRFAFALRAAVSGALTSGIIPPPSTEG